MPATFTEIAIREGTAVVGTALNIELDKAFRSVTVVADANNYLFQLEPGDSWTGANSSNVNGSGTTALIVPAAGKAAFSAINISDTAKGTSVSFFTGTGVFSNSLNILLSQTPGQVRFSSPATFTGTAALSVTTTGEIFVGPNAKLRTANGALTLSANQQATPRSGDFTGVTVQGTIDSDGGPVSVLGRGGQGGSAAAGNNVGVRVTGTGAIRSTTGLLTVRGEGGSGPGNDYAGVVLSDSAMIRGSGANVEVVGIGGLRVGTGNSTGNDGIRLDGTASISSINGNGTVKVIGTSGGGSGVTASAGVRLGVTSDGSIITSSGGAVQVTGTAGGLGAANNNTGVLIHRGTVSAGGAAPVAIVGHAGVATGAANRGVVVHAAGTVSSGTGAISLTATTGGVASEIAMEFVGKITPTGTAATNRVSLVADTMNLTGGQIKSPANVAFRTNTPGRPIQLGGGDTATSLGLTDAELDLVTAPAINIGDFTAGPITVAAAVTRAGATNVNLLSAGTITYPGGSLSSGGGTIRQNPNGKIEAGQVIDQAGLRIIASGNFDFATLTTYDPVQIGFTPSSGKAFVPLLQLPDGVTVNTTDNTISTSGRITSRAGTSVLDVLNGAVDGDTTQKVLLNLVRLQDSFFNGAVIDANQAFTTALTEPGQTAPTQSFTPTRILLRKTGSTSDTGRVELQGNLGFGVLNDAGVAIREYDTGVNRMVGTAAGFDLEQPATSMTVVPAGLDPAGKPLPISFNVAGMRFQADDQFFATYDAVDKSYVFSGKATADFAGGSITVAFGTGAAGLRIKNGVITVTGGQINKLTLGGLDFSTSGLTLAIDTTANTLTVTGRSSTNLANIANSPKFFTGFGTTSIFSSDTRIGSKLVLTDGVPGPLSLPVPQLTSTGFFINNRGTNASEFMLAEFDPATAAFKITGGSQTLTFTRTPAQFTSLNRANDADLSINIGVSRVTSGGQTSTGQGIRIANGLLNEFQVPVQSFFLQANRNASPVLDQFTFTPNPDTFATRPLLARYNLGDERFEISGVAAVRGPTGGSALRQDEAWTSTADFGEAAHPRFVLSNNAAVPSSVAFRIGTISWAGTTFTPIDLAATYDPVAKAFLYGGSATWHLGTQSVPVKPRTSGVPSGLAGFTANGAFTIDGLRLETTGFPLLFQTDATATVQQLGTAAPTTLTAEFSGVKSTVGLAASATANEVFVFEAGGLKKSANTIPRLVTTQAFSVSGLSLSDPQGRIDFPNTAKNATSRFVAQVGTTNVAIGDTTTKAAVTLNFATADGALKPAGSTLTLDSVRISDIVFQDKQLAANSSPTGFNFAGTGFYQGIVPVTIGGAPSNPRLVEERGVYRLIGFTPPPVDFKIAGVVIPSAGLTPTDTVVQTPGLPSVTLRTFTGQKVIDVGGAKITLQLGGGGTKGIVFNVNTGKVQEVSGTVTGTFTVGGSVISSTGTISYKAGATPELDELRIKGSATMKMRTATGPVTVVLNLGDKNTPGLVIRDGQITAAQASVTADFKLYGIDVKVKDLGVNYNADKQEFGVFGKVELSTPAKGGKRVLDKFGVTLGTDTAPGIRIKNGELERIDVELIGTINLYGFSATPENLRLTYTQADKILALTGGLKISLANKFNAEIAFPDRGIEINTATGDVQLRNLKVNVQDVSFGKLEIRNLLFTYDVDDAGVATITGEGEMSLPLGLTVSATVKVVDNKLSSIGFSLERVPGVPIGQPPVLFLSKVAGQVENLDDLDHFRIKASITATVGPSVKIFGQTRALVKVVGSIDINSDRIIVSGDVQLLEGVLGSGSGSITIFFSGNEVLRVQARVDLYPGRILRGSFFFNLDREFNVTLSARLGVYIPDGIKRIGGKELGSLGVYLQIRPNEARERSFVRFNATVLKILDVEATADFAGRLFGYVDPPIFKKIKFNFQIPGARTYSIPLDTDTVLSPTVAAPAASVTGFAAVPGSPAADITYSVETLAPATTTIDLYADSEADGYNGHLIASGIPFQPGTQTFRWNDFAAYAPQPYSDRPLRVYAVVNDGQNYPVYTAYSNAASPPDYAPGIEMPIPQTVPAGGGLVFSLQNDNPVFLHDPLAASQPGARVIATVSVSNGTLILAGHSPNVAVEGDGSDRITLTGTAADIQDVLLGMAYHPNPNSILDDKLRVSIGRYPSNFVERIVAEVDLHVSPIALTTEEAVVDYPASGQPIPVFPTVTLANAGGGWIGGARVSILGYQQGQDLLDLDREIQRDLGIQASFDGINGVLILRGAASVQEYQRALRLLTFSSLGSGFRDLQVLLGDLTNSVGSLTVSVSFAATNTAPVIVPGIGLRYVQGGAAAPFNAGISLSDADSTLITGATVSFEPGRYLPGEDILSMSPQSGITASFNGITGVLTLTGVATVAEYEAALNSVTYFNAAAAVTPGIRELRLSVDDDGGASGGTTTRLLVQSTGTALTGPGLVIAPTTVTAANDFTPVKIASAASLLQADAHGTITGLTVRFTGGFQAGSDFLTVWLLPDPLASYYDPLTGVLTITGVGSAAEYEFALRNIRYSNRAAVRDGVTRIVSVEATDGLTAPVSATVSIAAPALPVIDVGIGSLVVEHGRTSQEVKPDLTVAYLGGAGLTGAVIAFSSNYAADQDRLLFTYQNGITGTFDVATGVLTLSGTASVADYEAALRSVQYRNTRVNPTPGLRGLTMTAWAGAVVGLPASAMISVETVLAAPTINLGTSSLSFLEGSVPVSVIPNFSLADVDPLLPDGSGARFLNGAAVKVVGQVPGEDFLRFTPTGAITGHYDNAQGILFLSGLATFAEYQNVLRTVTYENLSEAPTTTSRNIAVTLQDGAAERDAGTIPLSVQSLNNPPIRIVGTVANLSLLQNAFPTGLGLSALAYTPPSGKEPRVVITVVAVPDASLGTLTLGDGSVAVPGAEISIDQLRGARFAPAFNGKGNGAFRFRVAGFNPILNILDPAMLEETVAIEVAGVAAADDNQAFVAQVYRDLLGRNAEASGLAHWSGLLTAGFSRSVVVALIQDSPESRQRQVTGLFQDLLGRTPSTAERDQVVPLFSQGYSYEAIRATIAGSTEYFQLKGGGTQAGYIRALYRSFLGREADEPAVAAWTGQLRRGTTLPKVADAIARSVEASLRESQNLYGLLLRRDPTADDPAGHAGMAGFLRTGSRVAAVNYMIASQEYYLRYGPTGVQRDFSEPSESQLVQDWLNGKPGIGNAVQTDSFPSVGILGDTSGGFGGGTLIEADEVLTAAHLVAGRDPADLRFTIGGTTYSVRNIAIHPAYAADRLGTDSANDLAVLKLDRAVVNVQPAALFTGTPRIGETVSIVGYGPREAGDTTLDARYLSTTAIDGLTPRLLTWNFDGPNEGNTVRGDSGGAEFLRRDGRDWLASVTSGGTLPSSRVGDYAYNTRVDAYVPWIHGAFVG